MGSTFKPYPLTLTISQLGDQFLVDTPGRPGSPPIGRGRTMFEAVGSWFHHNQEEIGLKFVLDPSAIYAEEQRRKEALSER